MFNPRFVVLILAGLVVSALATLRYGEPANASQIKAPLADSSAGSSATTGGDLDRDLDGTTGSIRVDPQKDGGSWLRLQDGRSLKAKFDPRAAGQILASGAARPLAMTSGDLDLDGFPDLIVAYASEEGGLVTVHRGNPGAFSPTDSAIIQGIADGQFPDPFLPLAIGLPVVDTPDFVAVGDFDRDGRQDILTAARGGSRIFILSGNGKGSFAAAKAFSVPGNVTSLIAGQKNVSDSYEDLVVGTADGAVLIFDSSESIVKTEPTRSQLPAAVTGLSFGQLDGDMAVDLAIAAGGKIFVLHGSEKSSANDGLDLDRRAGQFEAVELPFSVRSFVVGEFIYDRESRAEVAALGEDGVVRILTQGTVDTRPFSASEILAQRQLMTEVRKGNRSARDLLPRSVYQPRRWKVAEEIDGSDSSVLVSAHISGQPADDLIISNADGKQIRILNKPQTSERQVAELNASSEPIGVLPMRLNVMAQPSLVVLQKNQIEPTLVMVAPQATFNVTTNSDVSDPSPDGACTSCSLREAIQEANGNGTGADLITFNAGVSPVLTITGTDNAAALGDLDINGSLTITGNGSASTLIDTNYVSGCGDCKVFGINQDGTFSGIAVSFSGVTIQDGFNTATAGAFQETGGGIDFFLTGLGNVYSISDSVITSNEARTQVQSYGGGINIDSGAPNGGSNHGTVTLTNTTISNNFSDSTGGGLNLFADVHNVTFNNCVVSGNAATSNGAGLGANGGGMFIRHSFGGTVLIHDTDITANSAKGFGGGLSIAINQTLTIDNNSTVTNNTVSTATGIPSANGGGLQIGATSTTLSAVTITGNQANSGTDPKGGGVYIDGGTTTINNGTIGSNTAVSGVNGRGGGVAQLGGTLNVNTVTVSGNQAGADGGGFFVDGTDPSPSNPHLNVTNGSITTNTAARGGALATDNVSTNAIVLTTVSVTSNTATSDTGGIFIQGGPTGSVSINGMTFTGNTSPTLKTTGGTMSTLNTVTVDNNVTVAGGTLTLGSSTLNISGTFTQSSGTFNGNTSTVNLGGNFSYSGGTFNANTGTFNFNGSGTQSISASSAITFNNLSDANVTQPLTFSNSVNINGSLTANGANTVLSPLESAVIGGSGTLTGTGTARVTRATGTNDFLTQYTINNKTLTNLLIDYVGTAAQGISGTTYTNLRLNNASGGTLSAPTTVNGTLTLTSGAFNVGTSTLTLNNGITLGGGSLTSGATGTVNYNQGSNGQQVVSGSYGNLTFSNFNKDLTNANIGISGTFTPGSGVATTTGSTITFNGSSAQTIPVFNYNNLGLNNAAGASLGGSVTVGASLTLTNGVLSVGSNTLTLNGAAGQSSGSISSGVTGTVIYNQGSNGQSVLTGNYGNLTFSNFNKTLPPGTVGIAGTFNPGTATGHTITGNTIDFNGAGAQTIPALNYNNLTSSSSGARTLANSGTIGVAGTFTPGTNVYTITGSTIDFNGTGSQTIPAFNYNNLTSSNLGARTLSSTGTIRIAGLFTPGTNVYTVTGSTVEYNGASPQTLPTGFTTYNNLTINNAAGASGFSGLTVLGLLRVQAGTFTTASNFNNVQIDSGASLVAVAASTINVTGNWVNNGTFTPGTGTVNFNGSALQNFAGTFNNLTLNNAAGATLSGAVTVNGTYTATSGTLNIGSNTLTLNGAVSGTGSINSGASGTVNYNQGSNGQNILPGTYGNLTFSNFTKVLPNPGTVSIAGVFTVGATGGHTVTGSTVQFNGSVTQSLPAGFTPYNNLTVNNAAGVSLGGSITVNGALTLTSGEVNAGANLLTVGSGGSSSRTSGHVIGTLQKDFGGAGSFTYHVGTTGAYSPVDVTVISGSGSLSVKPNTGTAPATPALDSTRMLQRYWTLIGSGITSNVVFHYLDGDIPGTSTESQYSVFRIVSGGTALRYNPDGTSVILNTAANTFTVNDLSAFSDWTAGNPLLPTAAPVGIAGRVLRTDGRGVIGARVTLADRAGNIVYGITNPFGYYRFQGISPGQSYMVTVEHKLYRFTPRVVTVNDEVSDLDFIAEP